MNEKNKTLVFDQNPLGAIIGGILGIVCASAFWAFITYLYKLQIDLMAIASAFIISYFISALGRGVSTFYMLVGLFCSLIGCITGKLTSIFVLASKESDYTVIDLFYSLNVNNAIYLLESSIDFYGIIIYPLAVIIGYYASVKK